MAEFSFKMFDKLPHSKVIFVDASSGVLSTLAYESNIRSAPENINRGLLLNLYNSKREYFDSMNKNLVHLVQQISSWASTSSCRVIFNANLNNRFGALLSSSSDTFTNIAFQQLYFGLLDFDKHSLYSLSELIYKFVQYASSNFSTKKTGTYSFAHVLVSKLPSKFGISQKETSAEGIYAVGLAFLSDEEVLVQLLNDFRITSYKRNNIPEKLIPTASVKNLGSLLMHFVTILRSLFITNDNLMGKNMDETFQKIAQTFSGQDLVHTETLRKTIEKDLKLPNYNQMEVKIFPSDLVRGMDSDVSLQGFSRFLLQLNFVWKDELELPDLSFLIKSLNSYIIVVYQWNSAKSESSPVQSIGEIVSRAIASLISIIQKEEGTLIGGVSDTDRIFDHLGKENSLKLSNWYDQRNEFGFEERESVKTNGTKNFLRQTGYRDNSFDARLNQSWDFKGQASQGGFFKNEVRFAQYFHQNQSENNRNFNKIFQDSVSTALRWTNLTPEDIANQLRAKAKQSYISFGEEAVKFSTQAVNPKQNMTPIEYDPAFPIQNLDPIRDMHRFMRTHLIEENRKYLLFDNFKRDCENVAEWMDEIQLNMIPKLWVYSRVSKKTLDLSEDIIRGNLSDDLDTFMKTFIYAAINRPTGILEFIETAGPNYLTAERLFELVVFQVVNPDFIHDSLETFTDACVDKFLGRAFLAATLGNSSDEIYWTMYKSFVKAISKLSVNDEFLDVLSLTLNDFFSKPIRETKSKSELELFAEAILDPNCCDSCSPILKKILLEAILYAERVGVYKNIPDVQINKFGFKILLEAVIFPFVKEDNLNPYSQRCYIEKTENSEISLEILKYIRKLKELESVETAIRLNSILKTFLQKVPQGIVVSHAKKSEYLPDQFLFNGETIQFLLALFYKSKELKGKISDRMILDLYRFLETRSWMQHETQIIGNENMLFLVPYAEPKLLDNNFDFDMFNPKIDSSYKLGVIGQIAKDKTKKSLDIFNESIDYLRKQSSPQDLQKNSRAGSALKPHFSASLISSASMLTPVRNLLYDYNIEHSKRLKISQIVKTQFKIIFSDAPKSRYFEDLIKQINVEEFLERSYILERMLKLFEQLESMDNNPSELLMSKLRDVFEDFSLHRATFAKYFEICGVLKNDYQIINKMHKEMESKITFVENYSHLFPVVEELKTSFEVDITKELSKILRYN